MPEATLIWLVGNFELIGWNIHDFDFTIGLFGIGTVWEHCFCWPTAEQFCTMLNDDYRSPYDHTFID